MHSFSILKSALIIYFIQVVLSFTCTDLNDHDACLTVPGCSWTSESCDGSVSCSPPSCYFIDPAYSGIQSGTASQPYSDLFTPLSEVNTTSTLYIYNPVQGIVIPAGTGKIFYFKTAIK